MGNFCNHPEPIFSYWKSGNSNTDFEGGSDCVWNAYPNCLLRKSPQELLGIVILLLDSSLESAEVFF